MPVVPTDNILVPVSTCVNRRLAPPHHVLVPPTPSTRTMAGDPLIINVPDAIGPVHPSTIVTLGDLSTTPSPSPVLDPHPAPHLHPPPHLMVTRSRTSTLRPNPRYACVTTTFVTAVPSSVHVVLRDLD
jgi:hypothetical protein